MHRKSTTHSAAAAVAAHLNVCRHLSVAVSFSSASFTSKYLPAQHSTAQLLVQHCIEV
jgi:hypothetical protein